MTAQSDERKCLWLFFVVACAFTWMFWIPCALVARGVSFPTGIASFLNSPFNPAAFGPLFSALILTFLQHGGRGVLQLLGRGLDFRFKKIWLVAILFLPLVIFSGAILLSLWVTGGQVDVSVISNPPYALIAFFVILFTAGPLQEEFGWRGYALPRLQSRYSALVSSLILGLLWWLWHLPTVFIPGRFMTDQPLLFLTLSVVFVLTSILFTWIYNNTGSSILAALLMHASMNWSMWLVMPGMRIDLPTIGFMSLFLAIAVVVIVRVWGAARLSC